MKPLRYDDDEFTTLSGKRVSVFDPKVEDIVLRDIAQALSRVCRFGGHVRQHLSVAQHCVLVSKIVQDTGGSLQQQYRGLLHDASEAYVGDVISPLKHHLPGYEIIEDRWQRVIGQAFGVELVAPDPLVKDADIVAFYTEWRDNFPERSPLEDARPSFRPAYGMRAELAEDMFMLRYEELARLVGGRAQAMLR